MEVIEGVRSNRRSYLRSQNIAHISDKISDSEYLLGLLLVLLIDLKGPVIGQLDVQSSVVFGFDSNAISGVSWAKVNV